VAVKEGPDGISPFLSATWRVILNVAESCGKTDEDGTDMKFAYDFAEINGKVPMINFLDGLAVRERAKVFAYIEKFVELKSKGIPPKENMSKHLEDGIFELRVSFETRISRSFYFTRQKGN
jgi:hypothetical protein